MRLPGSVQPYNVVVQKSLRHGADMKSLLLSVIAVCLTLITIKLYIPEANAEIDGMSYTELRRDRDFKRAVEHIVERCVTGGGAIVC